MLNSPNRSTTTPNVPSGTMSALFDKIKDTTFFVKDSQGKFLSCNKALVSILKCTTEEEVIGKDDFDFFPKHIAEGYRSDDEEVMARSLPKLNIIELIPNTKGYLDWYITHKYPLASAENTLIGITGICQKIEESYLSTIYPQPLSKVLQYIAKNYAEKINIKTLAIHGHTSQRTLERLFKKTFGITAANYIKQTRVNAVSHLIHNSNISLSEIALSCGFCDQSYMTKEFKKQLGITPKAYANQDRS